MQLFKVMEMNNALSKLAEFDLPFSTSLAIAENIKNISCVVETYDKHRTKLIKEYCETDENGNPEYVDEAHTQIKIKDLNALNEELQKLLYTEVQVDIKPINLSSEEDLKISPKILAPLLDILQ